MRIKNSLIRPQIFACVFVLFLFETTFCSFVLGTDASISTVGLDEVNASPIQGVLESLGVFKNGVVVVRERYHVPESGIFYVMAPPFALHGTFFVQSDVPIETRSRELKIDVPITEERIDWVADFNGSWLTVVLPGENEPRVVRVLQNANSSTDDSLSAQDDFYSVGLTSRYIPKSVNTNKSVLLQCENGETIWLADSSSISSVVLKGGVPATVSRVKPVLLFDVKGVDSELGTTFYLSYLTRQASWAPQYRVFLKDEKNLEIEQSAILINDWRDFEAESTFLYSGFPQILLKNVHSPMSQGVDLVQFFNSLSRVSSGGQISEPAYMTQMTMNSVSPRDIRNDVSLPSFPEEDSGNVGVDIYTQPVGTKALKKGERVLFTIDKKSTEYRRIIRWDIVDARDSNGRVGSPQNPNSYGRTTTGQTDGSTFTEPWDVVVFRNPFGFPTTTGPASIYSTDSFLGQNSLYWRNPGEKTFLPVTKALGVRVNSTENERVFGDSSIGQELSFDHNYLPSLHKESWGNIIRINGSRFRCAVIDTTIELDNQRNETVEIEICRRVTGIPITESFEGFDTIPEISRLSDYKYYFYNVNPFSEASWTTTLKPKEKRVLKFSYQVLVLL